MKEIEISGANRFETFTKTRAGSRAVILRDGMILLSHETITGWWLVPGGGMENGETSEMCCVREVEEETGYMVRPLQEFLTLYEYYEEYRYISHYFICEVTGQGEMNLTDAEKKEDWSLNGFRCRMRSICFLIIRITQMTAKNSAVPICGNIPLYGNTCLTVI